MSNTSPLPFSNKIVLITGAGSGIGRATAVHLAQVGATLAICDINTTSLAGTYDALEPGAHRSITIDISSPQECEQFVAHAVQHFGRIDHVFNCAGINPTSIPTTEVTDEYWDRIMNTNLRGTFTICRAAIPHMSSGSSFVNVSSTLGIHGRPQFATYCASKFAVIGFSKALALELGSRGIRVDVVAPGYVNTPTNSGVVAGEQETKRLEGEVSMGRFGQAKEIAGTVSFLMSEGASYINGSVVEVDGGLGAGRL